MRCQRSRACVSMFSPTGLLSAIESTISLAGLSRTPTEITSFVSWETRTTARESSTELNRLDILSVWIEGGTSQMLLLV